MPLIQELKVLYFEEGSALGTLLKREFPIEFSNNFSILDLITHIQFLIRERRMFDEQNPGVLIFDNEFAAVTGHHLLVLH